MRLGLLLEGERDGMIWDGMMDRRFGVMYVRCLRRLQRPSTYSWLIVVLPHKQASNDAQI